nr:MAG TPA: hypothetical protein [Bacteriophage sp.]
MFKRYDRIEIHYYWLDYLIRSNGTKVRITLKSETDQKDLTKEQLILLILANKDFTSVEYSENYAHISLCRTRFNGSGQVFLTLTLNLDENLDFLKSIGFTEEAGTLWKSTGVDPNWCITNPDEVDGALLKLLNKFISEE